jgi:drug/metabolite transporter (DMT)-like permease
VLVATRFTASGALLLLFAMWRGMHIPRGRELVTACSSGILTLGIGNFCLVYSETLIPSGIAGLITTISPFWLVGLEALMPAGERLHGPTIAGMLVGLGGAALLIAPGASGGLAGNGLMAGFLVLQVGMATWSFGSIFQRSQPIKAHPVVIGAVQQMAAGLAFALPAALIPHHAVQWSTRGVLAVLYLMTFGSMVGYSAYVYALDRLPVAVVSIYSYVNAIVAVALGWLFYREPFGTREAVAMAVIFLGVGIVKQTSHMREPGSPGRVPAGPITRE